METEAKEQEDFTARVVWTYPDLPTITDSSPASKMVFATLARNVSEWLQFGALQFSFSELLGAPADHDGSMAALNDLLGPIIPRHYGDRVPTGTDIVPNALGFPLQAALRVLDQAHITVAEPAKEAISAYSKKTLKVMQKKSMTKKSK